MRLLPWLVPYFLLGCGGGNDSSSPASDGGSSTTFIAFAPDFAGFHGWHSADAVAPNDAGDGLHGVGPLRVYWNNPPPHGSTTFPVGTIIVKETEDEDVTKRSVFAMVKRGGGYNSMGAVNWEWFSLLDNTDGTVTILWHGEFPPVGESYANQAIGDCNGCHTGIASNDYVWDTALQLTNF